MEAYGTKVNHPNLKGNYAIHMAVENSFVGIVDLLIVRAVNRAQLAAADKVWYEHAQLGLIRAVVVERLSEMRPVQYTIRMRINQYHETLMAHLGATIATIWRMSVADKRLKPITESSGPPLKELIAKKAKMLDRFHKWDAFWTHYHSHAQPRPRAEGVGAEQLERAKDKSEPLKVELVSTGCARNALSGAEGRAIADLSQPDLSQPDRVLIGGGAADGGSEQAAVAKLAWLYAHWVSSERVLSK